MSMLLLVALIGSCVTLPLVGVAVAFLLLRCRNCGKLPVAGRFASGWPDFGDGACPHCGSPRGGP